MRAVAVTPGTPGSVSLVDTEVPKLVGSSVLLKVLRVGVCGTDRDIISGAYGEAPPNQTNLILGHESLCRVDDSPPPGFSKGDLVVPTVRRPCPEGCLNCRNGEPDACTTGHYIEHGIKGLHGFAGDFAATEGAYLTKLPEDLGEVGVLLEPLTIVEKGFLQSISLQRARFHWEPKRALVLGAGPVGLLATALLRRDGFNVTTAATRPETSLKATLATNMGASYLDVKATPLNELNDRFDLILEATGNAEVATVAQSLSSANGVVCFLGIYPPRQVSEDAGGIFSGLVLGNRVMFGSVNAGLQYFSKGAADLLSIKAKWPGVLERMITRVSAPEEYQSAYASEGEDEIKSIIQFSS